MTIASKLAALHDGAIQPCCVKAQHSHWVG
jgi:hypothetical protein